MNNVPVIETVPVSSLEAFDTYVGFSGLQYTIISKEIDGNSVAIEFTHLSQPDVRARMTFDNLDQPMTRIKK